MAMKFDKKAMRNTEISKIQVNFNQNNTKHKQPASLQKKPQMDKKQVKIRGKTVRWQHWSVKRAPGLGITGSQTPLWAHSTT